MLGRETLMNDPGHTTEQAEMQRLHSRSAGSLPARSDRLWGKGPQRRHLENEVHQLMEKSCSQRQSNVSTIRILRRKRQYDDEK